MVRCAQTFADPNHRGPAIIVLDDEKEHVIGILTRLDVLAAVSHYLGGVPDRSRLGHLAVGVPLVDAVNRARQFVADAIRNAEAMGKRGRLLSYSLKSLPH